MKFYSITTLAKALPALAIAMATSNMAVAQDNNDTPAERRERSTTAAPENSDSATPEQTPLSDTDCLDITEGLPPSVGPGSAQGANPQDNSDTSAASADADQRAGEETNSTPQITQNRDDCIDIRTERPETQD